MTQSEKSFYVYFTKHVIDTETFSQESLAFLSMYILTQDSASFCWVQDHKPTKCSVSRETESSAFLTKTHNLWLISTTTLFQNYFPQLEGYVFSNIKWIEELAVAVGQSFFQDLHGFTLTVLNTHSPPQKRHLMSVVQRWLPEEVCQLGGPMTLGHIFKGRQIRVHWDFQKLSDTSFTLKSTHYHSCSLSRKWSES